MDSGRLNNYTSAFGGDTSGGGLSSLESGTQTMTITEPTTTSPIEEEVILSSEPTITEPIILTLRPAPHVVWDSSVINNEGLGRKSSKKCCIFKKKKGWDESDTESDSDLSDDGVADDGGRAGRKKNSGKEGGRFHA